MRDKQMKQYVSPDREKAISQVSAAINNPNRVWHTGANLLDLLSGSYTAKVLTDLFDESRESNQIYRAAYNEAKVELSTAQQTTASAESKRRDFRFWCESLMIKEE